MSISPGIWKYEAHLPGIAATNRITLGEGNTPLIHSQAIGAELGLPQLYFKLEGSNPTGSYKDRIAAMALSLAKEHGRTACIGTTSGNAGASIAAYAARADIPYHVYVQENIVTAKLEQLAVYSPHIYKVRGMGFSPAIGAQVFETVKAKALANGWELAITAFAYAPQAMEAVKTISFEITEQLGGMPDAVFVPVGGGGLLAGIHAGFAAAAEHGSQAGAGSLESGVASSAVSRAPAKGAVSSTLGSAAGSAAGSTLGNTAGSVPAMAACQSAGCANLVDAWAQGLVSPMPIQSTSLISGLQVPAPPDADLVLRALQASGGFGVKLPDEQTWHWQAQLARREGIFCEPAAAISLAGVAAALQDGRIHAGQTIVCILSGAGFKDTARAAELSAAARHLPLLDVQTL